MPNLQKHICPNSWLAVHHVAFAGAPWLPSLTLCGTFCCLLALSPSAVRGQEQVSTAQEATVAQTDPMKLFEPREYADEAGNVLTYRLLKPLDYDPSRKYPLVVFLHGAGERGDDNRAQLKHGMADFCQASRRERDPCYVLAPQCPSEQKWTDVDWTKDSIKLPAESSRSLQLVFAVIDSMLADAAIDKNRIYITGLSMGGYGTWDALARRPDFFAAAAPICGGADTATAESLRHIPIWCFHGDQDKTVNVQYSRDMIAALKQAGGDPRYTEYPGVGHNSWSQAYSNDELYTWLFSNRRTAKLP